MSRAWPCCSVSLPLFGGAAGGPRYRRQPPGAPRSGRDRPGRQGRRAAVAGDRALRLVDTAQLSPFVHTGEESGSLPEMLMRHAAAESESLARAQADIMTWLPRAFYACVSLWMISKLLLPTS
ncbi:hypothetical protein LP420_36900 [Massilia sp. B-10]|nr:hypothetical protein LP420_36900 [Massilia sp. B-10]